MVNEVPAVPAEPVFELYQTTFPAAQVAVKLAVKPEQIIGLLALVGAETAGLTVTSTCTLVALGQVVSQAAK